MKKSLRKAVHPSPPRVSSDEKLLAARRREAVLKISAVKRVNRMSVEEKELVKRDVKALFTQYLNATSARRRLLQTPENKAIISAAEHIYAKEKATNKGKKIIE